MIAIFLIVLACFIIISGPARFLRVGRAMYTGVERLLRRQRAHEQGVERRHS